MTARWLVPALCFVVITGGLGITTKLALRHLRWPDMIIWTAIVYGISAVVIVLVRGAHLNLGTGDGWAAASGLLAVTGLVALFVALHSGPVTRVVPVTAAYPLVSALLAIAVFSERITFVRAVGVLMIVLGVVLLSVQRA